MPRANWHLDVTFDRSDPFASTPADPPAELALAERVDLTDPAALQGRLGELLAQEGELAERDVTCQLKDRPDSCCSACPLRGGYSAYRIRELCKLGTEQERTVMSLLASDV